MQAEMLQVMQHHANMAALEGLADSAPLPLSGNQGRMLWSAVQEVRSLMPDSF